MRKYKKGIVLTLAITIAALLCLQASAVNIVNTNKTTKAGMKKSVPLENVKEKSFEYKELGHTERNTASLQGGVLVSADSPEEDRWPAITQDQNGNIGVTWTHQTGTLDANIGMGYSQDNGEIWTSGVVELEGMPMYSDMAYVHGADFEGGGDFTGLWGVYGDLVNDQAGFYRMSDITNSETYEFYQWTTEYSEFIDCCISDDTWYNEFNYDITGPTNMYIYHEIYDVYDIPQCPTHWYVDGALEAGGVGYFDAQSELVTAPARDCDMACLHDQDPAQTTGRSEIVWKKIIPEEEPDIEYTPYQKYVAKGETYDAAHPNIGASGDNSAIVYMSTDNVYGDWDIKCLYSSDDGSTYEKSTVAAESQVDELYPAVYMSGQNVYCVYIKEGNLFFVKSEDGGATWDDPQQVNEEDGTVVEEENAIDIHPAGIVWTDNREGNKDIYYASIPGARLEISEISGGFGISATIANTGSAEATNVEWTISVNAAIGGGEATGTIDAIPAGGEESISSGLMIGVGPADISITANDASQTATGFMLGPLVLGVG